MNCSSLCGIPDSGKVDPVERVADIISFALELSPGDRDPQAHRFAEIPRCTRDDGMNRTALARVKDDFVRVTESSGTHVEPPRSQAVSGIWCVLA
jgi:hypothetical protein